MIEKEIYTALKNQFHNLDEVSAKAILKRQFAWYDHFAQNIYKYELQDGTIQVSYKPETIDPKEMWVERKFQSIINEWDSEVPMLAFNSIGEYLFFYKAVFHLNGALAARIILHEATDMENAYTNYPNEDPAWLPIESALYGTIYNYRHQ